MSRYIVGESVGAFSGSRRFSWHAFSQRLIDTARLWRKRERDRLELLHYLASDHRAAGDLGIDRSNAREWAERPFWQE